MSEELENTQDNAHSNDAPTEDELAGIRAQLEAEQASLAEAQAALTDKDDRIAELEASLAEARATAAEVEQLRPAHEQAVARYLEAVRVLNTGIPADLITGATVEAIDDSVAKAQTIADAVRASLAEQAKNARVPAGAPTREINIDGLDAREKISLGLSRQARE